MESLCCAAILASTVEKPCSAASAPVPSSLARSEQVPSEGSQTPGSWHWSGGVHPLGMAAVQEPLAQTPLQHCELS